MPIPPRLPTISAIGVASWDETYVLPQFPVEGGYETAIETFSGPGGTTANIAVAARRLGAEINFFSAIGSDEHAEQILRALQREGIETRRCIRKPGETDLSVILLSNANAERTIIWRQGPSILRGDRIDIEALFATDVTVVDCVDLDLRRFVTDLPAHTRPGARLIGTLTYLADVVADDKIAIALRHDVLVGNEREYRELLGEGDAVKCASSMAELMRGANLRLAVMTRGERGSLAIQQDRTIAVPARSVRAADSTGAGDAFAGALAFALALRWDIEESLRFANTVASFAVTAIGAQSGLPTLTETLHAMDPAR